MLLFISLLMDGSVCVCVLQVISVVQADTPTGEI